MRGATISKRDVNRSAGPEAFVADARLRSFCEVSPRVGPGVWIAPSAYAIGDVEIGSQSSLWYGSVLRGDVNTIRVGARTNLQDHCVVHVSSGFPCLIGDDVSVGHRAVVHGCEVGDAALIGIGAIVLDGAKIGNEAIVGAGAVVAPGEVVPSGMLVVGVPARVTRPVTLDERRQHRIRALRYVENARLHAKTEQP